jgi:hypothetical protein
MQRLRTFRERIRKPASVPWILGILGPIILFGPMLIRGRVLFWGTPLLQFVPWRQYALELLEHGSLPLWNPLVGMGAPLFANYQSALLYPPNLILALTGPAWGHGLLVSLHLIWAGGGMLVLVRRLGLRPFSQTVAVLAFSLSGYLVARGAFFSLIAAAAWLPWIIAAVDRLADTTSEVSSRAETTKVILQVALVFALQWLAGHAQTAWYSLLFACVWLGWRAFEKGRWWNVWRAMLRLLASGVFAFMLSAIQLLPTLEYMAQSPRAAALDPEFAMTYSFYPWRLLGLLLPELFGNPGYGDYWGYGNYWEDAIYIGVLPFLFALAAVWGIRKREKEHRDLRIFLVVVAVIVFTFALGKNSPIFPTLFEFVPTFDLFQAPTRWNLVFVFSIALLAAIGAESWRTPTGRGLYWARLGTAGAGAIGIAAWLGITLIPNLEASFVRAFAISGIWLFIAGLMSLHLPSRNTFRWSLLAGLLISADLVIAGSALNPTAPLSVYQGRSELPDLLGEDAREFRLYMESDLEYDLKFEQTHSFDTFHNLSDWRVVRDMGLPNTTILDGLMTINNFDPILPARYSEWMEALESMTPSRRQTFLELCSVGWQAVPDPASETGIRYQAVDGAEGRARLFTHAVQADSPEHALSLVSQGEFSPTDVVVLEGHLEVGTIGADDGSSVDLRDLSDPNRVEIIVNAHQGGWLVLFDTWFPGWKAKINGEVTTILRADYMFRSVQVPPGESIVEFIYQPPSLIVGAVLSLAAWLVLAWFLKR